jgi:SAM-dependent methyltransferase
VNFFSFQSAAERYTSGRFFFHPAVIERVAVFLDKNRLGYGLDVGCGTGLSTLALKEITEQAFGIDASFEMLRLARRDAKINFAAAVAENLPFADDSFEVATLSQVFHWLDKTAFFIEIARVLRSEGWLIVYDNYFQTGKMPQNESFDNWLNQKYLRKYPSPPRHSVILENQEIEKFGFELKKEERLEIIVEFDLSGLRSYLLSQSNLANAIEVERQDFAEARNWLTGELQEFFSDNAKRKFVFGSPIWYYKLFTK